MKRYRGFFIDDAAAQHRFDRWNGSSGSPSRTGFPSDQQFCAMSQKSVGTNEVRPYTLSEQRERTAGRGGTLSRIPQPVAAFQQLVRRVPPRRQFQRGYPAGHAVAPSILLRENFFQRRNLFAPAEVRRGIDCRVELSSAVTRGTGTGTGRRTRRFWRAAPHGCRARGCPRH